MLKSFFINSTLANYSEEEFNYIQKYLLQEGILNTRGADFNDFVDFKVLQHGAGNMSVDVQLGVAVMETIRNAVTFKVFIENKALENLVVANNTTGGNRIDPVILKLSRTLEPDALMSNVATLQILTGTGVTAMTDGAIQSAIGVDYDFIRLADITVANNDTHIVTANIADTRVRCLSTDTHVPNPTIVRFRELSADPTTPVAGDMWFNTTLNKMRYYDGATVISMETSTYSEGDGINISGGVISVDANTNDFEFIAGALKVKGSRFQEAYDIEKAGEAITALQYVNETEVSVSFASGTDDRNFADANGSKRVRQSFQLPISTSISRFKINGLKKVGTPTTDLTITLYASDGTTSLGSYTLPYQSLATAYSDFIVPLATRVDITANTDYWIDIRRSDDSYNGSNYYAWQSNSAGGYTGGKCQLFSGVSSLWSDDSTRDCRFAVYYNAIKIADDANNPADGYNARGFALANALINADVKIMKSGILSGFSLAKYDLGTLKTYWNFTSTSSSAPLVTGSTVGVSVTSWYFMDNIGFLKELDLYLTKYGTGQDVTITIQKMDFAGTYQTIWTKTLTGAEITTGVKTLYPNIAVDGGGAFLITLAGATTTAGNYIAWQNTTSGVYTNWSRTSSDNQVHNQNNQYCVIRGYDMIYKEDCPIYLQNGGAISHIPEGNYSYQVGRVIDKNKIIVNPPYEDKLIAKYTTEDIDDGTNFAKYIYFTIPPNATRLMASVGNPFSSYRPVQQIELNKVDRKDLSNQDYIGSPATGITLQLSVARHYGLVPVSNFMYGNGVSLYFYR